MDVESKQTIDEGIDRAQSAVSKAFGQLSQEESAMVAGAVALAEHALGGLIDRAAEQAKSVLSAAVADLDGWTVTIDPITIRISKPQK